MAQLSVDLYRYIFSYLDKASYIRTRRVCLLFSSIIPQVTDMFTESIWEVEDRDRDSDGDGNYLHILKKMSWLRRRGRRVRPNWLGNISRHTICHNPQVKMLNISLTGIDPDILLYNIPMPNVIVLKSNPRRYREQYRYNIHNAPNLRVIIDSLYVYIKCREECVAGMCDLSSKILIVINNVQPQYSYTGSDLNISNARPYVLIWDIDDCNFQCTVDTSRVQIYQDIVRSKPMPHDINPYVLIRRLRVDQPFMGSEHIYVDMPNLKCCLIFSSGPYSSTHIDVILDTLLLMSPDIEEVYIYCTYGYRERNSDSDSDSNSGSDSEDDIKIGNILPRISLYQGTNIKYLQLTIQQPSSKYIQKISDDYIPCCLSKIDRYDYTLTLEDIYSLYKHFDIPMADDLRETFADIGIVE